MGLCIRLAEFDWSPQIEGSLFLYRQLHQSLLPRCLPVYLAYDASLTQYQVPSASLFAITAVHVRLHLCEPRVSVASCGCRAYTAHWNSSRPTRTPVCLRHMCHRQVTGLVRRGAAVMTVLGWKRPAVGIPHCAHRRQDGSAMNLNRRLNPDAAKGTRTDVAYFAEWCSPCSCCTAIKCNKKAAWSVNVEIQFANGFCKRLDIYRVGQ